MLTFLKNYTIIIHIKVVRFPELTKIFSYIFSKTADTYVKVELIFKVYIYSDDFACRF